MGQTDAQAPDFCEEVQVSIVVPVLDEEENVGLLCQRIREALRPTGRPYELIIVDDGSTDDTVGALLRAQQHDAAIRIIQLRKNFGQTPALRSSSKAARRSTRQRGSR
jgi:glycosyltransferase involved in cell wall biosynthesis